MGTKDSFFKEIFQSKELVRQFVLDLLPKVSNVKFKHEVKDIIVENTSFSDPSLSDKESDVLIRITFQDFEAFVYILIEHQSTVDYLMPFRILVYMTRIWDHYVKERGKESRRKSFKLPPIIPVVFYDGLRRWTAFRNFKDMVSMGEEYSKLVPSFEYLLLDVKEIPQSVLRELNNAMGFIMMVDVPSDEDVAKFIEKLERIYRDLPREQKELVDRYMRSISALMSKVVGVKIEPDLFKEGGEEMFTILRRRIREDLENAERRGEKRGAKKEARIMLMRLLERKFGSIDNELKELIEKAPIEKVEEVALMIFDVESLEEVKEALRGG